MSLRPMQRRFAARSLPGSRVAMVLGIMLWLLAISSHGIAAEPDPADLIDEYIAAGEFAPAIALAQRQGDPDQRDRLLGEVAVAQASAGSRFNSVSTSGLIQNDLIRAQALKRASTELARGGGVQPDFDSLITLIVDTIAPESWNDVGGPGAIREFEAGVFVDAQGVMRRVMQEADQPWLAQLRRESRRAGNVSSVRRDSALRKVSLVRLERAVQLRLASGLPLEEEMEVLAGLQRIQYVMVYPETGDIVLAGPAGDWMPDERGRAVARESGRPVLRLDDLVVLLRQMIGRPGEPIRCSIDPRPEALADAQRYLAVTGATPLKPGQRNAWLKKLRDTVGLQQVSFGGIDPRTHVAHVLLEADHHMKLVGIGLEEGTLDVPSYLDLIEVPRGQAPPPLGVLRWWFTMNYDALLVGANRDVFQLRGQAVQVQSENELLAAAGRRVPTGQSDDLNQQFAHNFTADFAALAEKYPVYAELQNVFDLALVCALLEAEDLPQQVGWHLTCFGDSGSYQMATSQAPLAVETVINHRVIRRKHIIAAVSGGVRLDPSGVVARSAQRIDRTGELDSHRHHSASEDRPVERWWWD